MPNENSPSIRELVEAAENFLITDELFLTAPTRKIGSKYLDDLGPAKLRLRSALARVKESHGVLITEVEG